MKKYILFGLLTAILHTSCNKTPNYPIEPTIQYTNFKKIPQGIKDNKGVLTISFQDGDGDMGLRQQDTVAPYNIVGDYYYNFFVKYFEKQNGQYVAVPLPITNNGRIPYIQRNGQRRVAEGDIDMELFINNPFSTYDTIRYEVYIVDRALHASNTITTPDIIIKK